MTPRRSHKRLACALPMLLALASCGQDGPPPVPPLPEEALEAVVVEPGVSREALARKIDALFTEEGLGETQSVVVMYRGEVVAERYAEGFGPEVRQVGWSLSKTLTATLIGMLVADGRVRLDDPAPVPAWRRSGDPRGAITLRHLLQMRSGLTHKEQADPVYTSAEVQMMYGRGRGDMAAWAEAPMLEHDAGTTFAYSTATSVILADVATDLIAPDADADTRRREMADFVDARLAVPLGMTSLVGEYDAAGTLTGGSGFWATPRDWARFGEFLRNGGVAGGVQVVPRGWIDFMRTPSPAAPDYGAQLWLNRPSETERSVLFAEQGPEDAFALVGYLGQYVIVSPDQKLTVVRMGRTEEPQRGALVAALAEIFALYPRG
ncbi:serine hydrolase domain-containing protein [Aurantiacibacter luteus]|uniref:serine hydrolase domain-containing protein n=1 Tax=Aurantiacibacter luteus TaxID=1581420 RepID=UPI00069B5E2D|nr:serine hydrolase [Aurantiacibacter luteus]